MTGVCSSNNPQGVNCVVVWRLRVFAVACCCGRRRNFPSGVVGRPAFAADVSARLPTLPCTDRHGPLPCSPGPDSAQPCSALSVVRYSGLRCLCAAPLLPSCPSCVCVGSVAIVLHSGAYCPCRRHSFGSFEVKLAFWLLYVTPTTPFGVFTSCQLAARSALRHTHRLVTTTFCAPCHAKLEVFGAD